MFYLVKTSWWLRRLYPSFTWEMSTDEKSLYLSFDDGPHETATPFVLDQLKLYNAKATFFCIGKNVIKHPAIYQRILDEGHRVGNHSHDHLNGWKTADKVYIDNIREAGKYIDSNLYRPPYGKISRFQAKLLQHPSINISQPVTPLKIIMWTVLSADFDLSVTPEKCWNNVLLNTGPGSIILFHDSTKAWDKMSYALPRVLEHYSNQGFLFKAIK